MAQAELINAIFQKKQDKGLSTWNFTNGEFHCVKIDVSDYEIEPDQVSFKPDNYPYFRVALLDKHLEKTDC